MDFSHTDERRQIGDALNRWLREHCNLDARQKAMDETPGFNQAAWRELVDLGFISALVPAEQGGLGGEGYDIALVFEELGRVLAIEPWLSSGLMGARLLGECGAPEGFLPRVLEGESIVAVAHGEPASGYAVPYVETRAEVNGDGWRLTGSKAVVLHAEAASHLLVSARTAGDVDDEAGISLFLLDAAASGLTFQGYATIDGFRAAEVQLHGVVVPAAQLLGDEGDAFGAIERALAAGTLAVCAEALGAMEVARDITLDYLRTREQFGRPIGKFQALQHRMVDVATAIEQSRSLTIKAASAFQGKRVEREAALSAAKHYIGIAGRLVAEEAVQMHGGIGLAKETPINHYVKRLVMIDHLFGDTDFHLERYLALTR